MLKILHSRILVVLIIIILQAIQALGQNDDAVLFSKAKAAWLEQNDSLAVFLFKRLVKEYPKNKPIKVLSNYYLSNIALAGENYQESKVYLEEITRLPLSNKEQKLFLKYTEHLNYNDFLHNTFSTLGDILLATGNFREALFYFEESKLKYHHKDSDTPLFRLIDIESRAECYINLQMPDSALLLVLVFYLESNQYADVAINTLKTQCIKKSFVTELTAQLEQGIEKVQFIQRNNQNNSVEGEVITYIYDQKVLIDKYYASEPFKEEFQQEKLNLAKDKLSYFMNQLIEM